MLLHGESGSEALRKPAGKTKLFKKQFLTVAVCPLKCGLKVSASIEARSGGDRKLQWCCVSLCNKCLGFPVEGGLGVIHILCDCYELWFNQIQVFLPWSE